MSEGPVAAPEVNRMAESTRVVLRVLESTRGRSAVSATLFDAAPYIMVNGV